MSDDRPTHLDLFSGIGGFALAARWAGFRTIGFSEIDPYASAVLRKHWPDVPNFGDVRNVPFAACRLLTGGFPCQPFSVAGKRHGKSDDRYLWPEMFSVINRINPDWIVAENVPGIDGLALYEVLTDLESADYEVSTVEIPACAVNAPFYGNRIWIIAAANNSAAPRQRENGGALLYEPEPTRPHILDWEQAWPDCAAELCRMDDGIPSRVDRLKCLGNAIVPEIAYQILKAIRGML